MELKRSAWGLGLVLIAATYLPSGQTEKAALFGPYLGQKPPGLTPEVFAPGIVSKEGHQAKLFFNPDGSEAIYDERDPVSNRNRLIWVRSVRGVWSEPAVIPFSMEFINNEPCLAPDGKKLFFVSNRPAVPGGGEERTPSIWMSERTEDGWGGPLKLGPAINTPDVEVQPYFSSDGTLYFMRQNAAGRQILRASFLDGQFTEPVPVGAGFSPGQVSGPCVSPDGRVMILHSRKEDGFGSWDLYASFKDASGNWGELVNLGEPVNTPGSEGNATFSPDGRFLFYTKDEDIFWVSSKIIDELRERRRIHSENPARRNGTT
jgi:hypothetical protein